MSDFYIICIVLLREIAECSILEFGLPPGVVNVIPGPLEGAGELIEKHVGKIALWGSKNKTEKVANFVSEISCSTIPCMFFDIFYYGKCISIIFDSSDQSSAIEILLKNMSFSYQQLQMPWCVRTILVEESVFPTFATMLKNKLNSQKVGSCRDQGIDISLPKRCDPNTSSFLKEAIHHFSQRGIEVFQLPVADTLFFPPTLIIGTDAEMNSIVKDYEVLPFVAVMPFRNSKEALEFANKSHFGVAASVWTSCVSLAMYMASNLEVGTVWINDHGILDPSVSFSCRKQGFGCIGSLRGLQQFLPLEEKYPYSQDLGTDKITVKSQVLKQYFAHYGGAVKQTTGDAQFTVLTSSGNNFLVHECDQNDVKKAVDTARVAQQKWWKLGSNTRADILLNAADKFQETSKDFLKFFKKSTSEGEKELENCVKYFYYWASRCNNMMSIKNENPMTNYVVQNLREPMGVIGVVDENFSELEAFVLAVLSATSFGNSVVIILNCRNPVLAIEFCAFLSSMKVPPGLVNVLPGSKCALYPELIFHKDVQTLWYSGNNKDSLGNLHKMANKATKCLWKLPNSSAWDATDFEYAASFTKAVWLPSENASC
ncbi:Aldehyde dehydrogenase family 16 member A1 [Gryllus bimaculatus]|nr:Aldehyde dehydrogenase family 16 member A1 [Gryllus bimaculatus]